MVIPGKLHGGAPSDSSSICYHNSLALGAAGAHVAQEVPADVRGDGPVKIHAL